MIRQVRKNSESIIIQQAIQKPKVIFHYINGRLKSKDPVIILIDGNCVEVVENCEKAEHLGRFFASVFTREHEIQLDYVNSAAIEAGPVLEQILFPEPPVDRELRNLKEAKSSGLDD
ncbi:unnamed protein product [Schistocephalus solidus]|uniref:Fe-S_biosyn domain-containing protein n=1 Tax=Schistocephalus solidus TaxID=70667 RepID=A0A183TRZ6_SCHSO|nr:unnamed protein product [Schistocephalus solidus]